MGRDAKQKKRHDVWMHEMGEWKAREAAANSACDAITDVDALADALRDYLLAKADHHEFRYGKREAETTALWRRRANNESYRRTMAVFRLAKRLMESADKAHGYTNVERAEIDRRHAVEAAALHGAIEALLRSARPVRNAS